MDLTAFYDPKNGNLVVPRIFSKSEIVKLYKDVRINDSFL